MPRASKIDEGPVVPGFGDPGPLSNVEEGWDEVDFTSGGGFVEVDERGTPLVMNRPKPRGLLLVPPEIQELVARERERVEREAGVVPTPEAMRRMTDEFTLQYYYEGFDVAYRLAPGGVEILAVGHDEIGRLFRDVAPESRQGIRVGQP